MFVGIRYGVNGAILFTTCLLLFIILITRYLFTYKFVLITWYLFPYPINHMYQLTRVRIPINNISTYKFILITWYLCVTVLLVSYSWSPPPVSRNDLTDRTWCLFQSTIHNYYSYGLPMCVWVLTLMGYLCVTGFLPRARTT
jgi:hypothetical protein